MVWHNIYFPAKHILFKLQLWPLLCDFWEILPLASFPMLKIFFTHSTNIYGATIMHTILNNNVLATHCFCSSEGKLIPTSKGCWKDPIIYIKELDMALEIYLVFNKCYFSFCLDYLKLIRWIIPFKILIVQLYQKSIK